MFSTSFRSEIRVLGNCAYRLASGTTAVLMLGVWHRRHHSNLFNCRRRDPARTAVRSSDRLVMAADRLKGMDLSRTDEAGVTAPDIRA
jgi:hypothetical protein